jgi:hypothetical protein
MGVHTKASALVLVYLQRLSSALASWAVASSLRFAAVVVVVVWEDRCSERKWML